jgi:glycosyltransferase involved in cell wall biosynthesis
VIVTLCDKGYAGVNRACENLSRGCGLTRHLVLTHANPDGVESSFLLDHLLQLRPPLVLLCGGWSHLYERFLEVLTNHSVLVGMWWLSSAGQLGLAGEQEQFVRFLDEPRLFRRYVSSRSLAEVLGSRVAYLPCLLPGLGSRRAAEQTGRTGPPAISLFCGPDERSRKNVAASLLALHRLKQPYVLHLNGTSTDTRYNRLLQTLSIPFREHGWIAENKLDGVLRQMSLGLQVSFAESFGYAVVEHLLRGIPVVATAGMPSFTGVPSEALAHMAVNCPDNPEEIAIRIEALLNLPDRGREVAASARAGIVASNEKSAEVCRQILGEALP